MVNIIQGFGKYGSCHLQGEYAMAGCTGRGQAVGGKMGFIKLNVGEKRAGCYPKEKQGGEEKCY
jgi:hypothetical protein